MTAATIAETTSQARRTLSDLIAPEDATSFLQNTFGKQFKLYRGQHGRFADLLPWPALNRILKQHRLEPPRFRLVKDGKAVAPDSYLRFTSGKGRNGNRVPHLRVPDLTRELRGGATLILDAADELHEPIADLCDGLERLFGVRVQANVYAGWRTSQGFDRHWDDHDVFILQIAGKKHWKIYGLTREFPLARDVEPALDPPNNAIWDGFLEDGDVMYIPRGWWHEAVPLDEPTLHLTVGIHNVTGADLLSWFVDQLRKHPEVRQDIPRFSTLEQQQAWLNGIENILRESWTPGVLDEYVDYLNGLNESRPDVGLPWSATADILPPDSDFHITWVAGRAPETIPNADGTLRFVCNGKCYRLAAEAAPVLSLLQPASAVTLQDLNAATAGTLDRETLRAFVRELAVEGLVSISTAA